MTYISTWLQEVWHASPRAPRRLRGWLERPIPLDGRGHASQTRPCRQSLARCSTLLVVVSSVISVDVQANRWQCMAAAARRWARQRCAPLRPLRSSPPHRWCPSRWVPSACAMIALCDGMGTFLETAYWLATAQLGPAHGCGPLLWRCICIGGQDGGQLPESRHIVLSRQHALPGQAIPGLRARAAVYRTRRRCGG